MQYDAKTPADYLKMLEPDWRKDKLLELRALIQKHGAELEEGIKYGVLVYKYHQGSGFGLNAQKNSVNFYVGTASKIDPDGTLLAGLSVGKGCIRFKKTTVVAQTRIEDFIKKELLRLGYTTVYSPHIGRVEMYETSGHFPYYRDSQFPPMYFNAIAGARRYLGEARARRGGVRGEPIYDSVLRETSKRRPAMVTTWLLPRAARASGVTVREAVKYLPADDRAAILAAYAAGHTKRAASGRP